MATKNIARSALEGGRHGYNKWERRYSHNEERTEARDYCRKVAVDPEWADEDFIEDIRPVRKEFTDKLSPMHRWLEKQVGRSWADVRSEVAEKFDTRTTAGRHITYDHLLREVVDTESGFDNYGYMMNPNVDVVSTRHKYHRGGYSTYYVDESGILQEHPDSYKNRYRNGYYAYYKVSEAQFRDYGEWLKGCIIGQKDGKYYWFVPTDGVWKASWLEGSHNAYSNGGLKYYLWDHGPYEEELKYPASWRPEGYYWFKTKKHGLHWESVEVPFGFRQRGELSKEELKVFMEINPRTRAEILAFGKGR